MKFATVSKSVILGSALLLAATAFAATKGQPRAYQSSHRKRNHSKGRRLQSAVGRHWAERRTEHHARQESGGKDSRTHG